MSTNTGYSSLLRLSAAVVVLALAVSACQQGSKPQSQQAPSTSQQAPSTSQPAPSPSQRAESTIVLEVTGSGEVYAIWSDPFGQVAPDHTTVPFSKSFPLPADKTYVSLTWTSRDDSPKGCKITVDDKVVVEKPVGTQDNCVFTR